jgi:lysophospholipase L1-like esterase
MWRESVEACGVRRLLFAAAFFCCVVIPMNISNASEKKASELLPVTTSGNGLGHVFAKLKQGKRVSIGYFGGSITAGAGSTDPEKLCYRALTTAWFRTQFPEEGITEANAAIGGTGSIFGAARIEKDLIVNNPDLVFIEFAVNDNGWDYTKIGPAMEQIIRTIRTRLPETDIIMIYTIEFPRMYDAYKSGKTPDSIVLHQKIASHYGCSSINVGQELFNKVDSGKSTWADLAPDKCHPNDAGYAMYFRQIRDFLIKHRKDRAHRVSKLPEPLYQENVGK